MTGFVYATFLVLTIAYLITMMMMQKYGSNQTHHFPASTEGEDVQELRNTRDSTRADVKKELDARLRGNDRYHKSIDP